MAEAQVQKLEIRSPRHLADLLKVPPAKLENTGAELRKYYSPFMAVRPPRPFQRSPSQRGRPIDNPLQEIKWIQDRIYRRLLKPICFPDHILGAIPKRGVMDNAERHLTARLLVTVDVRQCFPSITNLHVYRVWSDFLGCSPPVASLLTQLTTYNRHLPQGAPTSPLLANLFIWMIDEPVRRLCDQLLVVYSTWIDDLAFSGERARHMIEPTVALLASNGLRVKREKIKIMGSTATKLLTGTRLGPQRVRAPKEKISRVRSGIQKLRLGLVPAESAEHYILGLVGQIRFINQLCAKDAIACARALADACKGRWLDAPSRKFLSSVGDAEARGPTRQRAPG